MDTAFQGIGKAASVPLTAAGTGPVEVAELGEGGQTVCAILGK